MKLNFILFGSKGALQPMKVKGELETLQANVGLAAGMERHLNRKLQQVFCKWHHVSCLDFVVHLAINFSIWFRP
jgi:hypothetical protein